MSAQYQLPFNEFDFNSYKKDSLLFDYLKLQDKVKELQLSIRAYKGHKTKRKNKI